MVEIISDVEKENKRSTYIISNGKGYYIDSTEVTDRDYLFETMIFDWVPKNGKEIADDGKDIKWSGIYTESYNSLEDMYNRHEYIIENFEKINLKEGN